VGWPLATGQVKGLWLVFESRQTTKLVPPVNEPPSAYRAPKVVASGSRWSLAFQPS